MSTQSRIMRDLAPRNYWAARNAELRTWADKLYKTVADADSARDAIYQLSPVALSGDPRWETACKNAKRITSNVRRIRTRVQRMLVADRDTIRIRPILKEAVPAEHAELMKVLTEYIMMLDGMGY